VKASIWPQNDATEVAMESANTGMRNRSTGSSGRPSVGSIAVDDILRMGMELDLSWDAGKLGA
jgi:hypothetical protein